MLLNGVWRRLLRISWTARRSNHSILKEISPKYSLERLILKLNVQYFAIPPTPVMGRADTFEKTLMLRKTEGGRRMGWQRMKWLDSITDLMDMSLSKHELSCWWTGRPSMLHPWGCRVRQDWATELNWRVRHCYWECSNYFLLPWNKSPDMEEP